YCPNWADNTFVGERVLHYQQLVETNLQQMLQQQASNGNWAVPPELKAKGWAGAAIWYNKIAEINGDLTGALFSLPIPTRMPYVMDIVAEQRSVNNENIGGQDLFNPSAAKGLPIQYPRYKDHLIAPVLNTAYSIWRTNANYSDQYSNNSQNIILATINQIFGTQGIFTMRCNPNIHPLAQLSTIGKGMMYAAIRNLAAGATISTLSSFVDNAGGNLAKMLGDFMYNVSFTTMAMSFILYYVLPFLPFIYFFFAVGGWLKSIFEAAVAMPLWALAHIRIDGNGIPPQGAMNGYYLLMEIFLRPVLIVFGLLGSIQIFSALVWVMNNSFDLIVSNVSGFDAEAELAGACSGGAPAPSSSQLENWRGAIDQFFFTAMYVILCYMMGLGCFKMIDYVPSNILRWVGSGASPLQEGGEEAASELLSKSYQAASLGVDKAKGGQLALLLSK
ncbi:MAG: DotA/TraY family protein, partial [Alphaproteobacteria bacterium]|nr:DotA/TraY family protein [Alphaproteobacteria bacterium]